MFLKQGCVILDHEGYEGADDLTKQRDGRISCRVHFTCSSSVLTHRCIRSVTSTLPTNHSELRACLFWLYSEKYRQIKSRPRRLLLLIDTDCMSVCVCASGNNIKNQCKKESRYIFAILPTPIL